MKITDLIEKLKEYPSDTDVHIFGAESTRRSYNYEYFPTIYFDLNGTILYLEGEDNG